MNLKDLRKKFSLTQQELAKMLGMKQNTISLIENNELEMKVSQLGKLIHALNLNAELYEELIDDQVKHAKPIRKSSKKE